MLPLHIIEYSCTLASQYGPPAWHLRIYPTWTFVSTGRVAQNPQLHRVPTFATCLAAPALQPPRLRGRKSPTRAQFGSRIVSFFPQLFHIHATCDRLLKLRNQPPSSPSKSLPVLAPAQLTCHFKEQFADSSNATRRAETTRRGRVFAHPVMFYFKF